MPTETERFELLVGETGPADDLAAEVRAGLGSRPRSLPCRYLYDAHGSELFERICALPEYYLTRTERALLATHADDIVSRVPAGASLVELGSGSASKTRLVIEALLRRDGAAHFLPVDISRSMLEASSRGLLDDYPQLRITGVAAEYRSGLAVVERTIAGPKLVLWLGSNVGNFPPEQATRFLWELRALMHDEDRLLVGADLRKDRATLEAAYDDAQGVTAEFSLNLLRRLNRELGADFDLGAFRHRARWNPERGCVEIHLVSVRRQRVSIPSCGGEYDFEADEAIHVEDSFKYTIEQLEEVASRAGFARVQTWTDAADRFSANLLRPA